MPDYKSLHQYSYGDGRKGFKEQCEITDTSKNILRARKDGSLTNFKVFIPPGTKNISIYSHCSQGNTIDDYVMFIIRKDQPPVSNFKNITDISANNKWRDFTLEEINDECFGKNTSGYVFHCKDSGLSLTEGCWVYVLQQSNGTNNILDTSAIITVDLDTYTSWYNSATWGLDGDPIYIASSDTPIVTPVVSSNGLIFSPTSLDFNSVRIGNTLSLKFELQNITTNNIIINSIQMPNGFTYSFINEYPAYQPSEFKSIYQYGKTFEYVKDGFPESIIYTGFKDIFNYNNPIICCGDAGDPDCCNTILTNDSYPMSFSTPTSDMLLKVYVPKGSKNFTCRIIGVIGSTIVTISRWKSPPDNYFEGTSTGLYNSYTTNDSHTLTDLSNTNDISRTYNNNLVTIVDQQEETFINDSGWIYIIVRVETGSVESIIVNSTIDMNYFMGIDYSNFKNNGDPPDD